jgi:hypothetical protein
MVELMDHLGFVERHIAFRGSTGCTTEERKASIVMTASEGKGALPRSGALTQRPSEVMLKRPWRN